MEAAPAEFRGALSTDIDADVGADGVSVAIGAGFVGAGSANGFVVPLTVCGGSGSCVCCSVCCRV